MQTEQLHAFVISTTDYGESDRIVSLFTLEHGRLRAFARGARASRKRFGAALEPFARIQVQARIKTGLTSLGQADIHSIYPAIRCSLDRMAHALYVCELIDAVTPEGQPLPRLYRLLAAYLDRLEEAPAREEERRFLEINLLNILGYRPALEECSRCGAPHGNGGAFMSSDGELTCNACGGPAQPVSGMALNLMLACLRTGKFGSIHFPAEPLAQASRLIDASLQTHSGRRLKSLAFLESCGLTGC